MAVTETRPASETGADPGSGRTAPGAVERILGGADHTTLGRMFVLSGLALFCVAIVARLLVGIDAVADNALLGDALAMVSSSARVLGPLSLVGAMTGVLVFLVPLQLGSPAISYPRGVSLAYWTWLLSTIVFAVSVAFDGGVGGADTAAARLGNVSLGAALAALGLAAVCVATTVLTHRPPGMGLAKVPFLAWSALLGSTLWIVTVGSAFAHVVVGQVSRADAPGLAENFVNGILWMTRAPAVYVLVIPVLGVALDVFATASGSRVRQYGIAQGLIGAFAVLSIGVWAQGDDSVNTVVWTAFALLVAVPVLGILGLVGDLVRRGRISYSPALLLSAVSLLFILGAVTSGLVWALTLAGSGTLLGFDVRLLGAAQVTFVAASLLSGTLAAVFHWSTKFWGGRPAAAPSNATALLVVAGGGLLSTAVFVQGLVQRDGEPTANQFFGVLVVAAAALYLLGVLSAAGAVRSASAAAADGGDDEPVGGTLEWVAASPARGDDVPDDLPTVTSPYPLADARDGDAPGEEADR